jgi:hypothetical protein
MPDLTGFVHSHQKRSSVALSPLVGGKVKDWKGKKRRVRDANCQIIFRSLSLSRSGILYGFVLQDMFICLAKINPLAIRIIFRKLDA